MRRFFCCPTFVSFAKPAAFLVILFSVTLYLNTIFPPISDDLHWPFVKEDVSGEIVCSDKRITSFSEVIQSCYNHRFMRMGNGRLANDLCIVLSSCFSKGVFNFLNSCAFICLVLLSTALCFRKISLHTLIITTTGLLLLLPGVPRTIFWMSGAVNYTWTACFALIFVVLMDHTLSSHRKHPPVQTSCNKHRLLQIGMHAALLIACMFHEAMAVTLLCSLVIYFIVNRASIKLPRTLIIFALVGTTYSLFNPAIFNRGWHDDVPTKHPFIANIVSIVFLSFIPMAGALYALIKCRLKYCILKKEFLVYCILLYLCLAVCVARHGSWGGSMFFCNLFLFIVATKYLIGSGQTRKNFSSVRINLLVIASVLICICRFALLCYEFGVTRKITTAVIQQARTNTERIIHVQYPSFTWLPYLSAGLSQSCSLNSRHQRWTANFYGTQQFTTVVDDNFQPGFDLSALPALLPHEGKGVRIGNTYVVRVPNCQFVSSVLIRSKRGVCKGSFKTELSPFMMLDFVNPMRMPIKLHYHDNCIYISFETDKEIDSCEISIRKFDSLEQGIVITSFDA